MNSTKIYIAGHNGMVGNAILKILKKKKEILSSPKIEKI